MGYFMFWIVLLFLYYYGLLVLAPDYGWSFFGDSAKNGLTLGFWRSCMESTGIPGPQGDIPPALNDAATHYVATVYGHGALPYRLRKTWAAAVMAMVLSVYGLCLALLANAPLPVLFAILLVDVTLVIVSGALTFLVFFKERSSGMPWSKRALAIQEIQKIQQHIDLKMKLDAAAHNIGASSVIWWPYPQDKGRFFRYTWRILAITLPAAYAVIAFFHVSVSKVPAEGWITVMGVWGTLLLLLTLATEWVLLVSALVWYGNWKGAEGSTRVSFPLKILLNDLEDLAK
ncbi:hypothetical protein DLNHIDIE_00215 [Acidithiobacillus thiooxidans ATCC 19377]|uniref:Uncharacterized protein n=2 Tax=Acidithiobacillus thiooxidans TaxID=930 RepID=A0A543Q209_ACITH|nr:hypothetical protein DLNHIDIE_00215 [Acidithiobacillus thiooxidans ATCC 19377]